MDDLATRRAAERRRPMGGGEVLAGIALGALAVPVLGWIGGAGYLTVACGSPGDAAIRALLYGGVVCFGFPLALLAGAMVGFAVAAVGRPFAGPARGGRAWRIALALAVSVWALGAAYAATTGARESCTGSIIGI